MSLGLLASSLIYTKVLPPPGELEAAEGEERASYQLVSLAAEAAAEATATELRSFGSSESGKKTPSPPPLPFDDDSAADGLVKVVVVVVPPSSSTSS